MTNTVKAKENVKFGDLELREVTGLSSDTIKAALIDNELVHPFSEPKLDDLSQRRLAPSDQKPVYGEWDKRCFGLFAPGSDFPQVAVYVNLRHLEPDAQGKVASNQLPGNISDILSEEVKPVANPNTAIFYTISNMSRSDKNPIEVIRQDGEDSPAERLIKEVAKRLGEPEHGAIQNFSTLSPLRSGLGDKAKGFAQWLDEKLESGAINGLLTPDEKKGLEAQAIQSMRDNYEQLGEAKKGFFHGLMSDLGVHYLAEEKSKKNAKQVRDPVGQFHLSNGAQIANIHYQPSATTESDQKGGGGLMVNYRYEPTELAARKKAYNVNGTVAIDPALAERHKKRLEEIKDGISKTPTSMLTDVENNGPVGTRSQRGVGGV